MNKNVDTDAKIADLLRITYEEALAYLELDGYFDGICGDFKRDILQGTPSDTLQRRASSEGFELFRSSMVELTDASKRDAVHSMIDKGFIYAMASPGLPEFDDGTVYIMVNNPQILNVGLHVKIKRAAALTKLAPIST